MRFFILMTVFAIVAVALQTTLLADVPWRWARFDFVVVAVAALAFYGSWGRAIPLVLLIGALVDVTSAAPFGISILSYVIIVLMVRLIIAKISFQGGAALLFWVLVVSLFDKAVRALVLTAASGDIVQAEVLLTGAPLQALLDALVGLALIPLLQRYWDLSWEKLTRPKGLVLD